MRLEVNGVGVLSAGAVCSAQPHTTHTHMRKRRAIPGVISLLENAEWHCPLTAFEAAPRNRSDLSKPLR